jgi:hypothetical protein
MNKLKKNVEHRIFTIGDIVQYYIKTSSGDYKTDRYSYRKFIKINGSPCLVDNNGAIKFGPDGFRGIKTERTNNPTEYNYIGSCCYVFIKNCKFMNE